MEDSEKLTALKKAYADIILNTAKEAAARIMVSERKAMRFQRELVSTKEESLRMLVRLKQMIDSKVSGAKMASLSQQKKIEELEAQLEEAEEIVKDLRAELREVQAELEKVTNSQLYPAVEQKIEVEAGAHAKILWENRFDPYESLNSVTHQFESATTCDTRNSTVIETKECGECCASCGHINNCYLHNPDFASIVIKRKEPELYRNGCTQRIRAFERSLFDQDMPLFGNVDGVQNEKLVRGDEGKRMSLTIDVDNMCEEEEPDEAKVVREDEGKGISVTTNAHSKCKVEKPDIVELVRRDGEGKKMFSVTDSKIMFEANQSDEHKVAAGDEGNGISVTTNADIMCEAETQDELQLVRGDEEGKGMSMTTNTDVMCEVEKRMALQSSETTTIIEQSGSQNDDENEIVCLKTVRRKLNNMERKRNVHQSRLHSDQVKQTNKVPYLSRENCSKVCVNETLKDMISPSAKVLGDTIAMAEQPRPHSDIAKEEVFLKACSSFNKTNDDKELLDKSDLTGQESLSTESLEAPVCKADVEAATESSDKLSLQASDLDEKVSSQSINDRFLKYTFRRKRKKESLSSPDADCSLEKSSLKKMCGENGHLEPQKSCMIPESSQDSL